MAKVIRLEYPLLGCVRIDLDPSPLEAQVDLLARELTAPTREGQIAFREGVRRVARLTRMRVPELDAPATLQLRGDASYLVSGGLGGLGLLIADWLVARGARHLVLVARRPPDGPGRERIARLERAGAHVHVIAADVASVDQMSGVIAALQQSAPPLRGVLHAAGMVDDGVLSEQTWSRFASVMAPKVQGAWNLHRLTRDLPLDFFMLFSSVASLLGSAGQSNYAAANAFLDALAHYRRALGLPALSVNWGAWSQVGMAHDLGLTTELEKLGMGSVSPEQGLRALNALLVQAGPQAGVAAVDWGVYGRQFAPGETPPYLMDLLQSDEPIAAAGPQGIVESLRTAAPAAGRQMLIEFLHARCAKVLKLSATQADEIRANFQTTHLNDLGFDSLMGIELRNRILSELKVDIPMHVFIGRTTVDELVTMIVGQLLLKSLIQGAPTAAADTEDMEVIVI